MLPFIYWIQQLFMLGNLQSIMTFNWQNHCYKIKVFREKYSVPNILVLLKSMQIAWKLVFNSEKGDQTSSAVLLFLLDLNAIEKQNSYSSFCYSILYLHFFYLLPGDSFIWQKDVWSFFMWTRCFIVFFFFLILSSS